MFFDFLLYFSYFSPSTLSGAVLRRRLPSHADRLTAADADTPNPKIGEISGFLIALPTAPRLTTTYPKTGEISGFPITRKARLASPGRRKPRDRPREVPSFLAIPAKARHSRESGNPFQSKLLDEAGALRGLRQACLSRTLLGTASRERLCPARTGAKRPGLLDPRFREDDEEGRAEGDHSPEPCT